MKQYLFFAIVTFSAFFAQASEKKLQHQSNSNPVLSLLALSLQAVGKQTAAKLSQWVDSGYSNQVAVQEVLSDFGKLNVLLKDQAHEEDRAILEHLITLLPAMQYLGFYSAFASSHQIALKNRYEMSLDKEGRSIAYVLDNNRWQVRSLRGWCDVIYEGKSDYPIAALRFTDDGRWLAVVNIEGVVHFHRNNNFDHEFAITACSREIGSAKDYHFFVSMDDRYVVAYNNGKEVFAPRKKILILDARENLLVRKFIDWHCLGFFADNNSILMHYNKNNRCDGNVDSYAVGYLHVFDIEADTIKYKLNDGFGKVSPQGNFLFIDVPDSKEANLAKRNIGFHHEIVDFASMQSMPIPGPVHDVTTDECTLALAVDGRLSIFDRKLNKVLFHLPEGCLAHTASFSPDNQLIGCDYKKDDYESCCIFDIKSQKMLAEYQGFCFCTWIKGSSLMVLQRGFLRSGNCPEWLKKYPALTYVIADSNNHTIWYQGRCGDFLPYQSIAFLKKGVFACSSLDQNGCIIKRISHEDILKKDLVNHGYDLFDAISNIVHLALLDYLLKIEKMHFFDLGITNLAHYTYHNFARKPHLANDSLVVLAKNNVFECLRRLGFQSREVVTKIARYQLMIDAIDKAINDERLQQNAEMPPLKKRCIDKPE